MHFFRNIFQFKVGEQTRSVLDTPRIEGDNRLNYNKLFTLKANGKVYYLAVSLGIESSRYYSQSINIFEIVNGKLNDNAKIIKIQTGLHSQLFYEYDLSSVAYWNGNKKMIDWPKEPAIIYDSASKTIIVPLVVGKGVVTHKVIRYKFTGQYFEKVKYSGNV